MIGTPHPLLGIRKLGLGFLNERADVCMYVWMEKLGLNPCKENPWKLYDTGESTVTRTWVPSARLSVDEASKMANKMMMCLLD